MNYRKYKIWDKDRTEIRKAIVPYNPGHRQFWLMLAGAGVLSMSILGGIVGILSTASITPYSLVQNIPSPTMIVKEGYQPKREEKPYVRRRRIEPNKPGTAVTPTPTKVARPIPPNYAVNWFPPCYHEPGWYYGWHGSTFEYGTDFDCPYHTPAVAIWGGQVMGAYRTCWNTSCSSTSGGIVIVRTYIPSLGIEDTYYLHLDVVSVYVGQTVSRGSILGYTGGQIGYGNWPTSPWFTSGPHIEIGFDWPYAYHKDGWNINPLYYIERDT